MPPAIEAAQLEKTYPPGVTAVDGVSLSVPEGTIFGLLGPNGAGKSTTVRMLCTLTTPDRGRASVAGIDVVADPIRVRQEIGVVGQKHGSDMEATGRENLELQGEFYGCSGRQLKQRIAQSLESTGLQDVADRPVKSYSGGMQRRLDVALGLLHRPQVLFLDEPTTGLDPEARVDMWHEIERLAAAEGMTILLTTHYMEEADRLASRLAIIDQGRIVAQGTPGELKRDLRGDSIQIELAELDATSATAALDRVDGLSAIEVEGRTLRTRSKDGSGAIPGVLAALETDGIKVASVTLARPSLDDVYLRHAGRAYHADAEEVTA